MSRLNSRPEDVADKDFQPLRSYQQSTVQNESWVNTTLTKTDADGTRSQIFFLAKK